VPKIFLLKVNVIVLHSSTTELQACQNEVTQQHGRRQRGAR